MIAQKFDGSKNRAAARGGSTNHEIEDLILRLARENRSWGYRRIAGALSNLGQKVCHQTVANVLKRHDLPPAPERGRTMTWREFIRSHVEVLAAVDFFTAEDLPNLTGRSFSPGILIRVSRVTHEQLGISFSQF